jgi:hypothetical protein
MGQKNYKILPSFIKATSANSNKFKPPLKNFLYSNPFYILKQYFIYNFTYTYNCHIYISVCTILLLLHSLKYFLFNNLTDIACVCSMWQFVYP